MSQNINNETGSEKIESSIFSLISGVKDYYKEKNVDNGYGWFVDIESNPEKIKKIPYNKNNYKPSKYVSIPETIPEYPTIRSLKSINNLCEADINESEKEKYNHKYKSTKNISIFMYCNIIGTITLTLMCYTIYFS